MEDGTKKELEKIEEPKAPILDRNFVMTQLGVIVLIIIAVVAIIAGIAMGYSWRRYTGRTYAGEVYMLLTGGTAMLVGVYFYKRGMKEKHEAYRQYERQVADYKISMEKYEAYNIYRFCVNKNINIQDDKALAIVSNNFTISKEKIVKSYYKGKEYAEELNYKKNVDRITAEKQKEKEEYDAIYQNTKIVGKDKYLKRKYKELEDNIKMVNTCDSGINRCGQLTQTKAKTSDWAILGGMANGIAGPAAGLATAYDIQKKNEEAKRNAEEIRSQAFDNQVFLREQKFNYEHKVYVLKNYIEEVNNRLYDESDPKEKMGLIHAMVQNYKILDTKNMRICLKFDCEKEIHILNSEALIDGSIQINILKNREIVGTTYYCAPGFDKDVVARTVTGFGAVAESETIALGSFEEGIGYEFEIKPYKLWCIER